MQRQMVGVPGDDDMRQQPFTGQQLLHGLHPAAPADLVSLRQADVRDFTREVGRKRGRWAPAWPGTGVSPESISTGSDARRTRWAVTPGVSPDVVEMQ